MIPVQRGPEPSELAAKRATHLANAKAHYTSAGNTVTDDVRKETDKGYSVHPVKLTLFARQHKKCAFCEFRSGLKQHAVEHFRPKKGAARNLPKRPTDLDGDRYWWLAWSWENLLFSCSTCNRNKGSFFPLVAGTPGLPTLSFNLSAEQPLLLDPAEPGLIVSQHLRWQPVKPALPPALWTWELVSQSDRGAATMAILEPEYRSDDVTDRFRETVWKDFQRDVLTPLRAGDRTAALDAWNGQRDDLLNPERNLVFATWCMLDTLRLRHLVPAGLPAPLPVQ